MVRGKAGRTAGKLKVAGSEPVDSSAEIEVVVDADVADTDTPETDGEDSAGRANRLTLRALAEAVAAATGSKKKVARDVVAATLSQIAAALDRGDELVLPPLGKLRMLNTRDGTRRQVIKLRLVRTNDTATAEPAATAASEALADAAE